MENGIGPEQQKNDNEHYLIRRIQIWISDFDTALEQLTTTTYTIFFKITKWPGWGANYEVCCSLKHSTFTAKDPVLERLTIRIENWLFFYLPFSQHLNLQIVRHLVIILAASSLLYIS